MEKGLYLAHVTDDTVFTVHADESVIYDAQTRKLFADRNKRKAAIAKAAVKEQRKADQQAIRKARKFRTMAKECLWLTATAALVGCTYYWGVYAAIAAVTGCVVAISCRMIHFITTEKEK